MAINPYFGINAHFNSYLQRPKGGWEAFHSDHITDLRRAISRNLPSGYYALSEYRLDIRDETDTILATFKPDVGIHRQPDANPMPALVSLATPILEVAFEPEADDDPVKVVNIYHDGTNRLVTRLELLSPKNKRQGRAFVLMREEMFNQGVHLVEMDYLHQQSNLFPQVLPNYAKGEAGAYPYHIAVNNCQTRRIRFYGWHVDDPLPTLAIPLQDDDEVILDFDEGYQTTVAHDDRLKRIDYEQLPLQWSSYQPSDQARIQAVMARFLGEQ